MLYRSGQLEYSLHLQDYDKKLLWFEQPTENDVYRAVLGPMRANTAIEEGEKEFFAIAECVLYEWIYLTPLFVSQDSLVLLMSFDYFFASKTVGFVVK